MISAVTSLVSGSWWQTADCFNQFNVYAAMPKLVMKSWISDKNITKLTDKMSSLSCRDWQNVLTFMQTSYQYSASILTITTHCVICISVSLIPLLLCYQSNICMYMMLQKNQKKTLSPSFWTKVTRWVWYHFHC